MKGTNIKGKGILGMLLTVCMLIGLTGCGEEKIIPEDYNEGNCGNLFMNPIMKTDSGFYYSQSIYNNLSLHYYDSANGNSMYLCNKPECRHDGNEFCAATSDKFNVMETVLYSGSLYINVFEGTEKTFEYKLLKAALDGSSLSEVVTYLTIDNVGIEPFNISPISRNMVIHRNKIFLPYTFRNASNYDISFTGTAIYDMDTGKLSTLGEEKQDSSLINGRFKGNGDYMYYVEKGKYKSDLYRYCYADGTVEKLEIAKNFKGAYTLCGETKVFYTVGNSELYILDLTTGENTKVKTDEWADIHEDRGLGYGIGDMVSDDEYVYYCQNYSFHDFYLPASMLSYSGMWDKAMIYITDGEGNLINRVDFNTTEVLGYSDYFTLHFCGDTIYMQTPKMVYACSRKSFIAGEPAFEAVYAMDIAINSTEGLTE